MGHAVKSNLWVREGQGRSWVYARKGDDGHGCDGQSAGVHLDSEAINQEQLGLMQSC
jgi:hypothetical protein